MVVIGHGKQKQNVIMASDEEIMRILGHNGEPPPGGFKVGKQIEVAAQWSKLQYFTEHAEPLKDIVTELRATADSIETATGVLK